MKLPCKPAVLAAVATALSLLGDQTLYAVLPTYYEQLALKPWHVGVLLSVNRWIRLLTNHLAERLCRRFSPGLLFCLSLTLGAGLTVIYAKVSLFAALVIARVLWGLCWSFIRQVAVMTVVETCDESETGQAMGFYNGISRTGSLAGNLLGGVFHDLLGFTVGLLAMAGISLLAVPFGGLSQKGVKRLGDRGGRGAEANGWRRNWRLVLCGLAVGWVGGLVMSTTGLILKVRYGKDVSVLWWVL
ncbi:MAG TPA: MFS transporter, partial [Armatimonadota bacterium]|nr:MFS transporter [Armatimonadota bacterium]